MVTITNEQFSIKQIGESGQCFRIEKKNETTYSIISLDRYLEVSQKGNEIQFDCTSKEYEQIWKEYFDLQTDYQTFLTSIKKEEGYLIKAAQFGSGIRILKQDLWEMILSFLISQQNNIKRIRRCITLLCERYGEKKQNKKGEVYYSFPTAKQLEKATVEELKECNLGYRSRYIVNTTKSILNGEVSLEAIKKMDYALAKEELLKLSGVGNKVADCVCLFALHHLDAFPVDTHINQVLQNHYKEGFPYDSYKGYAGIMQQYLFYYDLKKGTI